MNTEKDIRRLNLLGILHYVMGGVHAVAISIALILIVFELQSVIAVLSLESPISSFVKKLVIILAIAIVTNILYVLFLIISGRKMRQRKRRVLSVVIAILGCVSFLGVVNFFLRLFLHLPLPTYEIIKALDSLALAILGIFTLITLNKNSVKELYKKSAESAKSADK